MEPEIYPPPIKGFLDDLVVTTTTHIQARWFLSALEDIVSGASIKGQAEKCRCLAPRKGGLDRRVSRGDPINSGEPN